MAYKKYIKRNGKVYGPYVYHSRRVNGKVVSEYRGSTEKKKIIDYKKFILVFLGIFILGVIAYGFSISNNIFTGNAVLNLNVNYQDGEFVDGNLKVLLKEGELIPSSSKVVFETSEGVYEYNLEDIISNELEQGNYYIEGKNVVGQGGGYGVVGEKKVYPEVEFLLRIISSEINEELENESLIEDLEEVEEEIIEEEVVEEPVEEEVVEEELIEEIINESSIEEPVENESLIEEEIIEELIEEPIEEIIEEELIEEPIEEIIEEEVVEEEIIKDDSNANSEDSGIVSLAGELIFDFFSRLSLTGQVVLAYENLVNGSVSNGEEFVYFLAEGEEIEIVEGSVRVGNINLDENSIELNLNDEGAIITTDYFEIENGYGQEYLGNGEEVLNIDLSELGLMFYEGDLKISLKYEDKEILSLNTMEINDGKIIEETGDKILGEAEKIDFEVISTLESKGNYPAEEGILLEGLPRFLTESEKEILFNQFGQSKMEIKKFNIAEGNINVRFELEDYWVESVYDSSLSKEELSLQMDIDKTNWLKDVVSSVSDYERSQQEEQELEDLIETYSNN